MKAFRPLLLTTVLLAIVTAIPAMAGVAPYVRVDFGVNQLKMKDANDVIMHNEAAFKAAGYPASFQKVGAGYGPSGSIGLWLLPGFRVGATGSYSATTRRNSLNVPGHVFFAQDVDLKMMEFGGEAAIRIRRLAGLTLGGDLCWARAEMVEGFTDEEAFGQLYEDARAHAIRTTGGWFVGLDQTNTAGIAGFVRLGYRYRNVGSMPDRVTISDGVNTAQVSGATIPFDFSGFYVRVGVGYDVAH
jgi:hypothetical protein